MKRYVSFVMAVLLSGCLYADENTALKESITTLADGAITDVPASIPETFSAEEMKKQDEESFKKVLEQGAGNPDYLFGIGQLFYQRRQQEKAKEAFEQALETNAAFFNAKIGLGYVNIELKNYPKAKEFFSAVLAEFPENTDALAGLGRAEALQGNTLKAEELYHKALAIDPSHETSIYLDELNRAKEMSAETKAMLNARTPPFATEVLNKQPSL